MDAMRLAIEGIGWAAAVLILASYVLLSLGKIEARSYVYQWMNVFGAAGFIVNSGYNGAIPSAVLNVVWAGIGLFTLGAVWRAMWDAYALASPPSAPAPAASEWEIDHRADALANAVIAGTDHISNLTAALHTEQDRTHRYLARAEQAEAALAAEKRKAEDAREVIGKMLRFIDERASVSGYGFYRPANPHDFSPDHDSCSADELAAH